jgi:hypothetical protein
MLNLIQQFNKFAGENKSLIQKALTSAVNVGEALVPQHLEEVITNTVVRLSPEMALLDPEFDNQKLHEFNRVLTLPAAGSAMGEAAVTPTRNSTYERASVTMKVIRRKGSVTNFLQDSSKKYIDAAAAEMENHLLAHAFDIATYCIYGNATANAYEHDGIDKLVVTNRINEAVGGSAVVSLSTLDNIIDRNLEKQGANHKKAFIMSPRMVSRISQLLTNVRMNQGLGQVDIKGGWRLAAYRDIPIIASSAVRPTGTMTTVSTATATSGGTLPDSTTYYFRVAPVTYDGEQLASAEATQATGSGGAGNAHTITLSFTAYTGAIWYKVYMGTASGSLTLKRIVTAFSYDGSGTLGAAITSIVITAATAGTEVPSGLQSDVPLVASGGVSPELVILWDLDKYQGLGKYAYTNTGGSRFQGLVTIEPLAKTDDDLPFLIKTYGALVPSYEATSVIHRGLRIE